MAHAALSPLLTHQESLGSDWAVKNEARSSGVSWSAVIAGSFAAAALSLSLLALGAGVGLSSISPWSNVGASAAAIGAGAIVWMIVTQMISATMGGYLAGRLRTRWVGIHTDEVYFRDTAHGFLVWATGLVITAAFLASTAASIVGGRAQTASVVSGAETANQLGGVSGPNQYFVDTLFRSTGTPVSGQAEASQSAPDQIAPGPNAGLQQGEAGGIFVNALRQKDISAADKTYLGQLVAARTGLSQSDAEQRVSDVLAQARQAADAARKSVAHSLYWAFLALLVGAFCASLAATVGGRQRDQVRVI